ncbi:hypothetical protein AB0D11_02265 [Streptomyces monashensis]|uniref:zinc finger domain-containing protein n=1 Tax=Streptomyces monashensis TaxID=1678012 RepID=UPI0033E2C51F
MNAAEAARLLGHAAAFDNRTVGEATARAWATALRDIPLDQDTLDAVAAFYGANTFDTASRFDPTKRRWLEPHHVRYHRQQIRNGRLADANVMYAGNPDETPVESIQNRRALISAAASGEAPAQTTTKALTTGEPVDANGRGRAMLRAIGRESLSRRPEFAAPCPHCLAPTGQPCTNGHGHQRRDAHPSRIEASRAINSGETPSNHSAATEEIDRRRAAAAAHMARMSEEERDQLAKFQEELRKDPADDDEPEAAES